MSFQKLIFLAKTFTIPIVILCGILLYWVLFTFKIQPLATIAISMTIFLGSYKLIPETYGGLKNRHFALDYIAILAIIMSLVTHQYLVASIIALMISSGRTLDEYGVSRAKESLTKLIDRIPNEITLWINNQPDGKKKIANVAVGEKIFIRKGEVIPLDGVLESKTATIDESSLTGEPYPVDKQTDDYIRSGTINTGEAIVLKVSKTEENSTYKKIIDLVKKAQEEKPPLVRLANRYSTIFTLITFALSGLAYLLSFDLNRMLSVLVIATPCPLLLATPIALMGGVNASAKRRIIVKKLAIIEILSRINTVVFDKTGTITIGKPKVTHVEIFTKKYNEQKLLTIASAIERNSLHPLAKTIVLYAQQTKAPVLHATEVEETIGSGISGNVDGNTYSLLGVKEEEGMSIVLVEKDEKLAVFHFEDEIKQDSKEVIQQLAQQQIALYIFTGDKKEAAQKVADMLDSNVVIQAGLSPEQKREGIVTLKNQKRVTAMIGDGINDAPALAQADVGIVFTNEEQTAASEAADVVLLGGSFSQIPEILKIAKNTITIAYQSILFGIGISTLAMIIASFGFIPPLVGAGLQEIVDVFAILNSLRASKQ